MAERCLIRVSGNKPVDFLLCTPHILIISDRAKIIVDEIAKDEVEFLPVNVQGDAVFHIQTDFWVINILTIVDALDWQNTKWTQPLPPSREDLSAYMKIIKPCFLESEIQDTNIFRLEINGKIRGSKYISYRLKDALEKAGHTLGIEFVPIKTARS